MKLFKGIILFICSVGTALADLNVAALQATLDSALSSTHSTGAEAAVVSNGTLVWYGQSGVTAPAGGDSVNPNHLFAMGGVGKTYLATLVLQAVQNGQINLDKPIGTYIPSGLPGSDQVTVRMLLNQLSGYPDIYADPWVNAKILQLDYAWSRNDLLSRVQSPVFTPGSKYEDQNTNYIILGEILERATGKSVNQLIIDGITTPLSLTRTFVDLRSRSEFVHGTFWDASVKTSYDLFSGTTGVPTSLYGPVFMDHGIAATAADTSMFLSALAEGKLISANMFAKMLLSPTGNGYGMGIFEIHMDGKRWIGHNGGWGGYTSYALYQPDSHIALVTTTNNQESAKSAAMNIWLSLAPAVSPATTFAEWQSTCFTDAQLNDPTICGPAADPNHNGIPNLLEYVLKGSPLTASTQILPSMSKVANNFVFTFNRRAASAQDTTQIFQYSTDLSYWTNVMITYPSDARVALGVPDFNGVQTVTVTIPSGTNVSMFGRLNVSSDPGAQSWVSTLSGLVLSRGTLSPSFASTAANYATSVTNATNSITVTPTVTDTTATVKVNGVAVTSGNASAAIPLAVGNNTITSVVTAQDGTTQSVYTITVTRASKTITSFASWIESYSAITDMSPLGDPDNDGIPNLLEYVLNGNPLSASSQILPQMSKIANNFVFTFGRLAVSAQDTTQIFQYSTDLRYWTNVLITYPSDVRVVLSVPEFNGVQIVTVTIPSGRNDSMFGRLSVSGDKGAQSSVSTLSGLVLSSGSLSPSFASTAANYTASVTNATTSITMTPTVTDATATVKVNGVAVTSGNVSAPLALAVGTNTITTVVTAQNGSNQSIYTFTVMRSADVNNSFASWISSFPGLSDTSPFGDPDNDGIPNLLEYVLNGNPGIASPEILPKMSMDVNNYIFTFSRLAVSAQDTTQIFEYSVDSIQWSEVMITYPTDDRVAMGLPDPNGVQAVAVTIPKGTNTRMYGRLKVFPPYTDRVVSTIAFLGDSITANGGYTPSVIGDIGYWGWILAFLEGRAQLAPSPTSTSFATGGFTSWQIEQFWLPKVLSDPNIDVVFCHFGTNDNTHSPADSAGHIRNMWREIRLANKKPVGSSILPTAGTSAYPTPPNTDFIRQTNALLRQYAVADNVLFCDWTGEIEKPKNSGTGIAAVYPDTTPYLYDSAHPNIDGACVLGRYAANFLKTNLHWVGNAYSGKVAVTPNSEFRPSYSDGVGNVITGSATQPAIWNSPIWQPFAMPNYVAGSLVSSSTVHDDYTGENWWQIEVTKGTGEFFLSLANNSIYWLNPLGNLNISTGDSICGMAEVQVVSGSFSDMGIAACDAYVDTHGVIINGQTAWHNWPQNVDQANLIGLQVTDITAADGVLTFQTPFFTGYDHTYHSAWLRFNGNGIIRVRRLGLFKKTN